MPKRISVNGKNDKTNNYFGGCLFSSDQNGHHDISLQGIIDAIQQGIISKNQPGNMQRTLLTIVAGMATLVGSFFTTLWVLDHAAPVSDKIAALASSKILDAASLQVAVDAIGFKPSPDVRLSVDVLAKDGAAVSMIGWTADSSSAGIARGKPNTVLVFSGGLNLATFEPDGERPDVTTALNLFGPITKVVAYKASITCVTGAQIIIIAITVTGLYSAPAVQSCP